MTPKQHDLLTQIKRFYAVHGYMPSMREMLHMIGSHSTGEVHRLLTGLEERGFIRRLPGKSRAIEIIENPSFVQESGINATPLAELIREISRRGLVVGRFVFDHAQGEKPVRRFQQIKEEEVSHA